MKFSFFGRFRILVRKLRRFFRVKGTWQFKTSYKLKMLKLLSLYGIKKTNMTAGAVQKRLKMKIKLVLKTRPFWSDIKFVNFRDKPFDKPLLVVIAAAMTSSQDKFLRRKFS